MNNRALQLTVRLFKFALPHWRAGAVAIAGMFVYSGAMATQVALVKPMLDRMATPGAVAAPKVEHDAARPGDDFKAGLRHWVASTRLARWAQQSWTRWTSSFFNIGILAAMLAPVIFASCFWQAYFRARVLWSVVVDVRNALCDHLLPYSLSFYESHRSGELISNLTNDILTTQRALTFLFGDLFLLPIQLAFGLILAFHYSWRLALVTLVGAPVIVGVMRVFGRKVRRQSRGSLQRLADLTDVMSQLFSGIRVVKAFKMEAEESAEFHAVNQRYFDKVMKMVKARAAAGSIIDSVYVLAFAGLLIAGGSSIEKHGLTAGNFGGFIAACVFMVRPVKRLTKAYNVLQESLAAAERIFDLMDLDARLPDAPDAIALERFEQGVRFNNVSFSYDSTPVLEDVSFFAAKGQVVAFVGESGAGKTTLLNLVPRFYDPTKGTVEIDGIDVAKITRDSLLDHIAIVTQHPFLFNRSFAENIRYGRRSASMEQIVAAAKAANIHDFIVGLPQGYDSVVGEMGEKLSGGQRQRVTIARAILKDPSILILDEATSSLDTESERLVQSALNYLMKGRTTLVIAHRLSTIQHADKIIVLHKGRIVEEGSHAELLAMGGEYRRLHDMQFASSDVE